MRPWLRLLLRLARLPLLLRRRCCRRNAPCPPAALCSACQALLVPQRLPLAGAVQQVDAQVAVGSGDQQAVPLLVQLQSQDAGAALNLQAHRRKATESGRESRAGCRAQGWPLDRSLHCTALHRTALHCW